MGPRAGEHEVRMGPRAGGLYCASLVPAIARAQLGRQQQQVVVVTPDEVSGPQCAAHDGGEGIVKARVGLPQSAHDGAVAAAPARVAIGDLGVQGAGCRVGGAGCRVQGAGCATQGAGRKVRDEVGSECAGRRARAPACVCAG